MFAGMKSEVIPLRSRKTISCNKIAMQVKKKKLKLPQKKIKDYFPLLNAKVFQKIELRRQFAVW